MELMSVSTISYNSDLKPCRGIRLAQFFWILCRRGGINNTVEVRFEVVMPVLLKIRVTRDVELLLSEIIVRRFEGP
jgi:hypothetical protein